MFTTMPIQAESLVEVAPLLVSPQDARLTGRTVWRSHQFRLRDEAGELTNNAVIRPTITGVSGAGVSAAPARDRQ